MEILETLGINPQIVLANIISFLLLLWLLSKVAIKPLSEVLRNRRDEIETSYRHIEEENARVQATQAQLARELDEIKAKAVQATQEASTEASRVREEIIAQARADAEQVKQRSVADIERERDKALQVIREQVADLVLQAGEKVLGEEISGAKHRELVARTISDLESMKN